MSTTTVLVVSLQTARVLKAYDPNPSLTLAVPSLLDLSYTAAFKSFCPAIY